MEARWSGGSWRNVDVGDLEVVSCDVGCDDDGLGDAVVDRRWLLRVAEGVMDEGEKAPATAARAIKPNGGVTRKLWQARISSKFSLLNASDDDVITREEMV